VDFSKHDNETSGSIKDDQLSECKLPKKDYGAWS
jgi:hypothetical protein